MFGNELHGLGEQTRSLTIEVRTFTLWVAILKPNKFI